MLVDLKTLLSVFDIDIILLQLRQDGLIDLYTHD